MRLLTFKNLPYLALALVEAYVFDLAIWYCIRESFNQETEVMILLGCMVVYFLIPSFLSGLMRKYEILWSKVLSFSILSGITSAVLTLLWSAACVSGLYFDDPLSVLSSFWDYFWSSIGCFLLMMVIVHLIIGFWSVIMFISQLVSFSQRKTVEPETEEVQ